jgi:hypothetical protein
MANKKGAAGGAAAAGGTEFQAYGAAWLAVKLLIGNFSKLPWDLPEGTVIRRVECEQDEEVDDVLSRLSTDGTVYLQFKHGLTLGSEFDKAMAQMVRQYHAPGFSDRDRLVIFTDLTASGTVRTVIKNLLDVIREDQDGKLASLLVNESYKNAYASLKTSVTACWPAPVAALDQATFRRFLMRVHVTAIDLQAPETVAGSHELLGYVTDRGEDVWYRLVVKALSAARKRYGFDRLSLWQMLRREDIDLSLAVAGGRDGTKMRMDEVAAGMTREVISFHVKSGFFDPGRYVVRSSLDLEWRTFCASDARLFVLSGQSGHGKTNALLHYSTAHHGPLLLIRGEDLEAEDIDLCASVYRLVARFCSRQGMQPPAEYELRQWLCTASLMLVVDGLDRSALAGAAGRWMDGTCAWLAEVGAKLVLGTRPETWSVPAAAVARLPWLMYRSGDGKAPLMLEMFTPEEAWQAAERLGRPDLARYTHPGMMALAAVSNPGQAQSLRHCEVIDRYLAFRRHQIVSFSAGTPEEVVFFLDDVAATFLRAGSGSLPVAALKTLRAEAPMIYRAARMTNLLVGDDDKLRLHPDEVAEHLQAQQLDIDAELARLEEILHFPIRLGILRSAIVQLEARDQVAARKFFGELIDRLEAGHALPIRALCVAIALELREWDGWMALFVRVVRSWDRPNLKLQNDPLAELLSSPRLAPMERIALLWQVVWQENGYDWRAKHWLTPEYAPNFHITLWARLMQQAMVDAGSAGLSFAMEYFDAKDDLGCDESNLGDLAKGLFFRVAATLTNQALDLLISDDRSSARAMANYLCDRYPAASIAWLSSRLAEFSNELALKLLLAIPVAEVKMSYREIAVLLLDRIGTTALRRNCLVALTQVGDLAAAVELAGLPELDADDINLLLCTRGAVFSDVLKLLFGRIVDGSLSLDEVARVFLSGMKRAETEELLVRIEALVVQKPSTVSAFSFMFEGLLGDICRWEVLPVQVEPIMRAMLTDGSERARKHLIFFSADWRITPKLSGAGARFQRGLLDRLLATETAENNLLLLVKSLLGSEMESGYVDENIASLYRRFPQFDLMDGVRKF